MSKDRHELHPLIEDIQGKTGRILKTSKKYADHSPKSEKLLNGDLKISTMRCMTVLKHKPNSS